MAENTKYWKGLEELTQEPEFVENAHKEFPEYLPIKENRNAGDEKDASRRDFLKLMGFSVAAVSLAACETPVKNVIPYASKPESVDPGKANWYATSYVNGGEFASVLVKNREGRPIKIDSNPKAPFAGNGVNARIAASVLDLYDNARNRHFYKGKEIISQKDADTEIIAALEAANKEGKGISIVTSTILSPTVKNLLADFKSKYSKATVEIATYDAISYNGFAQVYEGKLPSLDFSKSDVIVGFSADFLGTWISPVEFAKQYAHTRKLGRGVKETMSRHYQFESNMSLTGANADYRQPLKTSEEPYAIAYLYNFIASKLGATQVRLSDVLKKYQLSKEIVSMLDKVGNELLGSKGKSIVVAGSNDNAIQLFIKEINSLLQNVGKTVITEKPLYLSQSQDSSFEKFIASANNGKVDVAIFYNCNPGYDYYDKKGFTDALGKVATSVSLSDRQDETSSQTTFTASITTWLENWGDAQPIEGVFAIAQPTITPIFQNKVDEKTGKKWETRSAEDSLLVWSKQKISYYQYLKDFWFENVLSGISLDIEWRKTLTEGFYTAKPIVDKTEVTPEEQGTAPVVVAPVVEGEEEAPVEEVKPVVEEINWVPASLQKALNKISKIYSPEKAGFELVLYESVQLGNGKQANNPWLQETPDPISKVTWDNYASISLADAKELGVNPITAAKGMTDLIEIIVKGKEIITIPAIIQPGQAKGTIGIALGYGRDKAGKLASGIQTKEGSHKSGQRVNPAVNAIGVNAYPYVQYQYGTYLYHSQASSVTSIGETYPIARTQTQQTIMGRNIIQGGTFKDYSEKKDIVERIKIHTSKGEQDPTEVDLWKPQTKDTHTHPIHLWNLSIDLNSCIGCSACHVSCQSENNIPVVGKAEVKNRRDMHWMRIDRYYSSDMTQEKADEKGLSPLEKFSKMEEASANPNVTFQPMLCQHCNHAPCETVCPVAATSHSSEGLNQMAYNRCIGTRYCANNCPYKVRRFNWFNYSDNPISEREFKDVNVAMNDDLGRMVLNPDVMVRARGTMEKCSMCVQRIQETKLTAKLEKRKIKPDEFQTACASACPTNAITFGDYNDEKSTLHKEITDVNKDRRYDVLDEVGTQPNVHYLAKVKNVDNEKEFKF